MLLRQTAVYMLANIVTAALGLASVMLFTRMLEPGEYGIYVVALSVAGIINAFLFNWGRHAVLRHYNDEAGSDVRLTVMGGYLAGMALLPLALGLFALFPGQSPERVVLAMLLASTLGVFEFGQEVLRARMDTRAFMISAITRAVFAFVLGFGAVRLGFGGTGLVITAALSFVIGSLVRSGAVWRGPRAGFARKKMRGLLAYGMPITMAGVLFALYAAMDRLVVAYVLGDVAAGQYGAAADLTRQIITFPALAIGSAVVPLAIRLFESEGKEAADAHLARSLELLVGIMLPAAAGFAITAPDVARLFLGSRFSDAAAMLMPILAGAWVFNAISQYYLHVSFQLALQPRRFVMHGLGGLVVASVFIPVLVLQYGMIGAAAGLVLAEAGSMGIGLWLTRGAHPMPVPWLRLARIGVATAIMGAVTAWVHDALAAYGLWALWGSVVAGGVCYGVCALALDIAGMRRVAGRWMLRQEPETASSV